MPFPVMYTIDSAHGGAAIRLFGGGPGLAEPWSSPEIEAMVAASDVFWNEVPKLGPEAQALAIQHGVDPERPLATWLSPDELKRVERAADSIGVQPQLLARARPWLAAQGLKMAAEARAGLHAEYSAEQHLAGVAERAGVPVRSEFGTTQEVIETFSSWPRQVEIERLMSTVAEIEAGLGWLRRQSDAWLAGDLEFVQEVYERYRAEYPAFYEHLIVRRNRAWVDRVRQIIAGETSAFILVGSAHLVGPESVPVQLEGAGIPARRA